VEVDVLLGSKGRRFHKVRKKVIVGKAPIRQEPQKNDCGEGVNLKRTGKKFFNNTTGEEKKKSENVQNVKGEGYQKRDCCAQYTQRGEGTSPTA